MLLSFSLSPSLWQILSYTTYYGRYTRFTISYSTQGYKKKNGDKEERGERREKRK